MKKGKSLIELASELTRIQESKKDFIVPTSKLAMNEKAEIVFANGQEHNFKLTNWSAGQVASYADVPKAYFDRLREQNPALLSQNVNHGLGIAAASRPDGKPDGRLVRTLDGKVRGFLSSRYRMLDAHDLLETTLPVLLDNKFEVISSEVTDRRLYLKTTSPKIAGEVKTGDVVQYGVVISTSDVGAGSLRIEPFVTRLVCMNGMIRESSFKKAHLGTNRLEREVQELMSDKTKQLNDAAFFATVRDYLLGTMNPENLEREINRFREAAGMEITNFDLEQVVELSMEKVGVKGETIKKGILNALASGNEGAGLTKWGLANSFTRAAQMDELDYDTATELERAGGLILDLGKADWQKIAVA